MIVRNPTPVNYDLLDIWHARTIARAMDYTGADDSDENFASFATALMKAYDRTATARAMKTNEDFKDRPDLREIILAALKQGHSMVDMPSFVSDIDMDVWNLAEVMQVMTHNVASLLWMWDEMDWLNVEATMKEDITHARFMEKFDITKSQLETLERWYGVSIRSKKAGNRFDVDAAMRRTYIAEHMDVPYRALHMDLCDMGLECSLQSVYHMQTRIKKSATAPV